MRIYVIYDTVTEESTLPFYQASDAHMARTLKTLQFSNPASEYHVYYIGDYDADSMRITGILPIMLGNVQTFIEG